MLRERIYQFPVEIYIIRDGSRVQINDVVYIADLTIVHGSIDPIRWEVWLGDGDLLAEFCYRRKTRTLTIKRYDDEEIVYNGIEYTSEIDLTQDRYRVTFLTVKEEEAEVTEE